MYTQLGKHWRFHGIAPDGQHIHMYFTAYRQNKFTSWNISLFIGGTNRRANDWHNKQKPQPSHITGKGSISALKYALDLLLDFSTRLKKDEQICVVGEDERRHKAYRRLLKYPNWEETNGCYYYLNPKYWALEQ